MAQSRVLINNVSTRIYRVSLLNIIIIIIIIINSQA
jgi:hypothetical protein